MRALASGKDAINKNSIPMHCFTSPRYQRVASEAPESARGSVLPGGEEEEDDKASDNDFLDLPDFEEGVRMMTQSSQHCWAERENRER